MSEPLIPSSYPFRLQSNASSIVTSNGLQIVQPDFEYDLVGSIAYRQKKFQRLFKSGSDVGRFIDDFFCALAGEIPVHGHLYITEKYFGFYSNVFGYMTKILIPVSCVVRVTKEKTAKIFPSAVGVYTYKAKYIFSSFMSRDTAYKVMLEVLKKAGKVNIMNDGEDDSEDRDIPVVEKEEDFIEEMLEEQEGDETCPLGPKESPRISELGSTLKRLCTPLLTTVEAKSPQNGRYSDDLPHVTNPMMNYAVQDPPQSPQSQWGSSHFCNQLTCLLSLLVLVMLMTLCVLCYLTLNQKPSPFSLDAILSRDGENLEKCFMLHSHEHHSENIKMYEALTKQMETLINVRKNLEHLTLLVKSHKLEDKT